MRLRTKKGLQGGKTIQQRSEFFASRGTYCSYQFHGSCPCALCTHVCVSTTLCLLSFASLPHCWSFPELGPMTQTDLSASMCYILTSLNKRTNRIGDLTRHRIFWGSPLMVPLRVHMLSIDYQNYQIQRIKVINKTGHPAYWTRHKETLNCQPI